MSNDIFDIDLSAAADKGAAMTLKHPVTGVDIVDEHGNPSRIFLKGSDSPIFRQRLDYYLRKNGKNNRKQMTLAELEEQNADALAHVTTGWENIKWKGADLPFSIDAARTLYKDRAWVRQQADEFVGETENFLPSNTNS